MEAEVAEGADRQGNRVDFQEHVSEAERRGHVRNILRAKLTDLYHEASVSTL